VTSSSTTADPQVTVRWPTGSDAPMTPHAEVRAGGRVVASATVQLLPGVDETTLNIHIDCAAGHQPAWARRLLVHDLLNRAEHVGLHRVLMVVPLGDTVLEVLRDHCDTITTRSAGVSCIVEAEITPPSRTVRAG
jgi:hypothetical protein